MKIKKFSFKFFLASYGILFVLWLLCTVAVFIFVWQGVPLLALIFALLFVVIPSYGVLLTISLIHKHMVKGLPQIRDELSKQGFEIEYENVSRDEVYFLNYSAGKVAALFSMNPTEPQFIDPTMMEGIHTNDHKSFLNSTNLIACEYKLMDKTQRICTLMVTGRNTKALTSPEAIEAISKADQIGELLKTAQQNAAAKKANV